MEQRQALWTILPGKHVIDGTSNLFIDNFIKNSQALLRSILTMRMYEEGIIKEIGDSADMTVTEQPTNSGGYLVSYLYPEQNAHLLSVEFHKDHGIDLIFNVEEGACRVSLMK